MDPETGTIVGSPLTQWKTKILWIFAPAKHRIKARGGRAAVSSVCSFICLSAVILHNYTLSNQKDARGREGSEQPARPPLGREGEERRMAHSFAVRLLPLSVRSTTAPPLRWFSLSFRTVWSFCWKPNGQGVKTCDASSSILVFYSLSNFE